MRVIIIDIDDRVSLIGRFFKSNKRRERKCVTRDGRFHMYSNPAQHRKGKTG